MLGANVSGMTAVISISLCRHYTGLCSKTILGLKVSGMSEVITISLCRLHIGHGLKKNSRFVQQIFIKDVNYKRRH